MLGFVFLRALPNLRYPLWHDQGVFCVIGQGILKGQLPYRDLWDIKPPGIYYIYALIVKLFGPVMWCAGAVDIFWLLAISCCIFYFARRFLGTPAAALAMVFNAVRHCRQGYLHAGQAETFLMLCVFAAWFVLIPGKEGTPAPPAAARPFWQRAFAGYLRYWAAGLFLGAAFWLKYNAVAFYPFLALIPFLDFQAWDQGSTRVRMEIPWRDWLARMSIVAAGFLLVVLGVIAYFWAEGAWQAMKEAQLEVLPRYGATAFQWNLAYFIHALQRTQDHLGFWTEFMPAIGLLIAWRRRELRFLAPAFLFAIAGYISTASQGRFHPYAFETCYPFFSMFWGYVCVKTWDGFQYVRWVFAQRGWTVARTMLWLVLFLLGFSLLAEESVRVVQQYQFLADWWRNPELSYRVYYYQIPSGTLSGQLSVINFLKKNSTSEDEVYVWGFAPLINFLAQRQNPSRFVVNHVLISPWGPKSWRQELVRTLETKRPRYIVVERGDVNLGVTGSTMDSEQRLRTYPALANLLRSRYKSALNYSDFEVYELKRSPEANVRTPKSEG